MARAALVALSLAAYFAYLQIAHQIANAGVQQLRTLYTAPTTQLAAFSAANR